MLIAHGLYVKIATGQQRYVIHMCGQYEDKFTSKSRFSY